MVVIITFLEITMATRKVYMKIEAEVILTVDEGIPQDEYELDLVSDNHFVDIEDFTVTKTEITDSK